LLIVEDEEMAREVLVQALEAMGFDTLAAGNGREALEVLKSNEVDLIVSDIYMPLMNGLDLLRTLRQEGSSVPVILITGFDPTDAYQIAREHGASGILVKPFRLMQLRGAIDDVFAAQTGV